MRYVRCNEITVAPDRQRQEFNPERLAYLQSSIENVGLLAPLIITEKGELVAGERRLKAINALHMLGVRFWYNGDLVPVDCVPAILPNESGPLALYEIELEENIARDNLTWQEQAQAVAKLKALREQQAVITAQPLPTAADLAEEIRGSREGSNQAIVRKQLIVAQHLANPEVAKAKSVDDAFKILKRNEAADKCRDLATSVGKVAVTERLQILHGNCLDLGWKYLDNSGERFDIICTDPPYGMGAESFGDGGGAYVGVKHSYDDSLDSWKDLMNRFAQLSVAITKPNAHLYLCCDIDGFGFLKECFNAAGWRVHRTPLVCFKRDANRVPWPQQGPRRSYELVLYAVRGDKPTTAIYPDVFDTVGDDNLGHGAQKPVAFWDNLLQRSAVPGDRVLDPFAGTGGILVAAHQRGLYCTAMEREAQYYGICLQRLEGLK